MRTNKESAGTALAVLAVLAFAAGCGALPTSPVSVSDEARAPSVGENAANSTLPGDDVPPGDVGGIEPVPVPDPQDVLLSAPNAGALSVRRVDVPEFGFASVQNGRWRINVPLGAIEGSAKVSVTVPGSKSPACDLGIVPEDMNHFAVPVILVADCHGVSPAKLATYVISWYNPATGQWVPVPGSVVDVRKKTVTAPLLHFSVYSVGPAEGKSGW